MLTKGKCLRIRACALLCVTVLLVSFLSVPTSAATYRKGANEASEAYRAGRYYQNFSRVTLTGDGVTDVLAVALSQLGYQEGDSDGAYGGEVSGSGNYSEYYYNFGIAVTTWSEPWCAAFVSWALYQSQVTDQGKLTDWCRGHMGDETYIWREISCQKWAEQLRNFDRFKEQGTYQPQSGDLIFFDRGNVIGHIGLVVWCDGDNVYTIEGNTSSGSGIEANGGGVYYKSYELSNTGIAGYGVLPYERDPNVLRVDYSGQNMTTGLYMVKTGQSLAVSYVKNGTDGGFTVPMHTMFEVTDFQDGYAVVTYDGRTGYAVLSRNDVLQITATKPTPTVNIHSSNSFYVGGDRLEEAHRNDPNLLVSYPNVTLSDYANLQDFGANKANVLINGWTWAKWAQYSETAIEQIWLEGNGEGEFYLGFSLNDPDALLLPKQYGMGEHLESIVFKKGFQFTDGDEVVTLERNVILLVRATGGFEVLLDGVTHQPTQSKEQYGIVTGISVNVRSEPNTDCEIFGQVNKGDRLEYLEKTSGNWYQIRYGDKVAWISSSYFTVTGQETVYVPVPMELAGYTIEIGEGGDATISAKNEEWVQEHHFIEKYDDFYHWIVCECGEIKAIEAHRWDGELCTECAYGTAVEEPTPELNAAEETAEDTEEELNLWQRIFRAIGDFFRGLFQSIAKLFGKND